MGSVYLSDASEDARASVISDVPTEFAKELHRHSLVRGAWSKLLSPWKIWLKRHFQLHESDALPDGVPLVSHPPWTKLARCLRFRLWHRSVVRSRKHINLLELESIMELERALSAGAQDKRYLCGSDSQIALAAIVKGRSSSPRLNRILLSSLPTVLGAGLYGSYGYVPSKVNVSDDPTRNTEIRAPLRRCQIGFSELSKEILVPWTFG